MKASQSPYHHHGMHKGAPTSSFIKARHLRQNMTLAQKRLWEFLKEKQLGYKFRQQHPIHIYIVDFYCHELGLIIEVDGEYHNEAAQIKKDTERSELLKFQDLNIMRFSNDEIHQSIEIVLKTIKDHIKSITSGLIPPN